MTHTPGPWSIVPMSMGDLRATIVALGVSREVGEARHDDAPLIAAAPDLLDIARNARELIVALHAGVSSYWERDDLDTILAVVRHIDSVIAKASLP